MEADTVISSGKSIKIGMFSHDENANFFPAKCEKMKREKNGTKTDDWTNNTNANMFLFKSSIFILCIFFGSIKWRVKIVFNIV